MVDVPPVSLPASLNTSASTARPQVVQIRNTCPATPPHCLHRLPVSDVDVLRCYVPCFIPSVDSSVDSSVDVVAGNSVGAGTLVPVSSFASPGGTLVVFASTPASPVVSSSFGSSTPGVNIPHFSSIAPLVNSNWLTELQGFPDPVVVATVPVGIQEGFHWRLGFKGNRCKSMSANMRSVLKNPLAGYEVAGQVFRGFGPVV